MATKFLVISLLLANVLLYGLKLSSDPFPITPAEASTGSVARTDLPEITLLAELPAIELQFLASTQQCFSIGPIQSLVQVDQLINQLAEYTSESQKRTSQAQVDQGFWVFLDALDSRAQALEFANELGSMGLTDYFVIASGDMENTISLGLYRDEQNARKRQQALRALGFNPRILPRYKTVDQFWLDYQLAQGSISPWAELKASVPTAVQLELPCSAPDVEVESQQMHAQN